MSSLLDLEGAEVLRRTSHDVDGNLITYDEINRYTTEPGFQASIYYGIPAQFAEDKRKYGFPEVKTEVGPAWYIVTGSDSASVAVINEGTEIVVRLVYLEPGAVRLPELDGLVKRAVELSALDAVLKEGSALHAG